MRSLVLRVTSVMSAIRAVACRPSTVGMGSETPKLPHSSAMSAVMGKHSLREVAPQGRKPGLEDSRLGSVTPSQTFDSASNLADRKHAGVQLVSSSGSKPRSHVFVYLRFANLRHNVCVQQVVH